MAFTTDWMWRVVDRRKDYSVSAGVESFRENWTLSRYRVTDQAYTSELGDTASSLAGENGGVTETIAVPTGYTYYAATSWDYTDSIPWYSAGYQRNGKDAYIYSNPSPKDASKSAVMFYESHYEADFFSAGAGSTRYWWMTQCSSSQASSGTFPTAGAAFDASDVVGSSSSNTATPANASWQRHGTYYADTGDTFTVSSAVSTLEFRCTADSQSYDQPFVDWFTQTQTWVVKSPWA